MKVMYSMEHFHGPLKPYERAGIFRVASTLAEYLMTSSKCDLAFNCSAWLNFDESAFAEVFPKLRDVPVVPDGTRGLRRMGKNFYSRIRPSIKQLRYIPHPGLGKRILMKLLYHTRQSLVKPRPAHFEGYNIFHSPFLHLPKATSAVPGLRRFQTVYDLTPILYTRYFVSVDFFRLIMENLGPNDWIICISQCTKDDLLGYHRDIDPEKIFVIPLAADADIFYPCQDADAMTAVRVKYKLGHAPYLLALNTLEPRKNLDFAIKSFARLVLQCKIKDLTLVLAGPMGWRTRAILDALEEAPALKERIIVTGYVPDEELAALYSGALAFLYPSFYEGFGLPPLEAMQCGVPVITSNTSSLPEVVGKAAITVHPRDGDALCHGMWELYSRPSLRQTMRDLSLQRASLFTWNRTLEETLAAYQKAIDAGDTRTPCRWMLGGAEPDKRAPVDYDAIPTPELSRALGNWVEVRLCTEPLAGVPTAALPEALCGAVQPLIFAAIKGAGAGSSCTRFEVVIGADLQARLFARTTHFGTAALEGVFRYSIHDDRGQVVMTLPDITRDGMASPMIAASVWQIMAVVTAHRFLSNIDARLRWLRDCFNAASEALDEADRALLMGIIRYLASTAATASRAGLTLPDVQAIAAQLERIDMECIGLQEKIIWRAQELESLQSNVAVIGGRQARTVADFPGVTAAAACFPYTRLVTLQVRQALHLNADMANDRLRDIERDLESLPVANKGPLVDCANHIRARLQQFQQSMRVGLDRDQEGELVAVYEIVPE